MSAVTQKGQVTIPKPIRERLRLKAGSRVAFDIDEKGDVVLRRADGKKPKSRFAHLVGIAGPGMTTDEIMKMTRGDDWGEP
jgi:AbrB family looped-hinge helix DNA binding protein